jgi:hypothetical protein
MPLVTFGGFEQGAETKKQKTRCANSEGNNKNEV